MVRDEIFVDLNGRDPRLAFVGYTSFAADTHDGIVGMHTVDEVFERVGVDFGISVDLHRLVRVWTRLELDLPSSRPQSNRA